MTLTRHPHMPAHFRQITEKNEWEYITYQAGAWEIPGDFLKKHVGKTFTLKFPDGTELPGVLSNRTREAVVHDMGQQYEQRCKIYFFKIKLLGTELWVPINHHGMLTHI